jgi:diguanylate cyclase (GGDEF)-like protein/PAS domain S-box-containing protein
MILDIKTLMVLNLVVNVVGVGAMLFLYLQNHGSYRGLGFWLVDMGLQVAGSTLILLRGVVPDLFSMALANTMVVTGAVFLLAGMARFVGKPIHPIPNGILVLTAAVLLVFFSVIQPDLRTREIVISVALTGACVQTAWLLLHRPTVLDRRMTLPTGVVMLAYVLVNLVRVVLLIERPLLSADFFRSGWVDALPVLFFVTLSAFLTVSIVLMVNYRLVRDVRTQEEKFNLLFMSSPNIVILTRLPDGRIIEVNRSFEISTGHTREEALGRTTVELRLWDREEDRMQVLARILGGAGEVKGEYDFRKKDGGTLAGLFTAQTLELDNEKCLLVSVSDITALSEARRKLQTLALYDPLTGLANRVQFQYRYDLEQADAQFKNRHFVVASIDLDWFKHINDEHGHDIGDRVLVAAAKRLTTTLRRIDTVSRFGGDEFVLLLGDVGSREDAGALVSKIVASFREPLVVAGSSFDVTISVGAALYPEDGTESEELVKKSDRALYEVKKSGRNGCRFSDETGRTS